MSELIDTIRVLHVDDEPSFSDLVATFLEREDDRITVHTATRADEGRKMLSNHEIDCIVSDHDMPGQNGIEFLETVREEYPDLPFILYTGKGSEEVASEAISKGVSDYLQKGSDTDQYTVLANRIINLVTQYRAEIQVERFTTLREESEQYRDRLLDIVSDRNRSTDDTIQNLLELGWSDSASQTATWWSLTGIKDSIMPSA